MKAKLGLVLLAALVIIGFGSCSFNGVDLSGTEWRWEVLGTGSGLVFDDSTTGNTTVGALGSWSDVATFTYVYDSASKTGTITQSGIASDFTISDDNKELTWELVTYTYK